MGGFCAAKRTLDGCVKRFVPTAVFFLAPQAFWAVGKWESWFWISTFPRPTVLLCVWSF